MCFFSSDPPLLPAYTEETRDHTGSTKDTLGLEPNNRQKTLSRKLKLAPTLSLVGLFLHQLTKNTFAGYLHEYVFHAFWNKDAFYSFLSLQQATREEGA
jgi:hypothetical protein